jgi:hypothetical protein
MQLISHPDPQYPGAVGMKFAPENGFRQDGTWLPMYFLPWEHLKIMQFAIPGIPHSLAEWDDEEHPRFFFTAGINGCSVFAHGDPQSPTISHGGLQTKLARSAGEFWRMQMAMTKSGYSNAQIRGEVNKHDYMHSGGSAKLLAEDYLKFLEGDKPDFKLEIQSPVGCVFGIRYGRSWTLYLQKSVVYNKIRYYLGDQMVEEKRRKHLDYRAPDGRKGQLDTAFTVARKVGPLSVGKKEFRVFATTQMITMPLDLAEIYPNRRSIGELKDVFHLM